MDSIKAYLFADWNNPVEMEKWGMYHRGGNCWTQVLEKVKEDVVLNTNGDTGLKRGFFIPSDRHIGRNWVDA